MKKCPKYHYCQCVKDKRYAESKKCKYCKCVKGVILKPLGLSKYGYEDIMNLKLESRKKALTNAVKIEGYLPIFRRLIILSTLNKNKNPKLSKRLRIDAKFVKKSNK